VSRTSPSPERCASFKSDTFSNFKQDMKSTLDEIKSVVNTLAEKINAPQHLLPTYGQSIGEAHPC
jgi:hypothetical protein